MQGQRVSVHNEGVDKEQRQNICDSFPALEAQTYSLHRTTSEAPNLNILTLKVSWNLKTEKREKVNSI